MNRLLIAAILIISTLPLYAQGQTPNAAQLKSDAQKVVSIIKGNKEKTQVYCQINDLGEQLVEANQKKDHEKAEALSQQITELEKKLGPEYIALVSDLNSVDPNSPEAGKSTRYSHRSTTPARIDEMREEHRRRGLGE